MPTQQEAAVEAELEVEAEAVRPTMASVPKAAEEPKVAAVVAELEVAMAIAIVGSEPMAASAKDSATAAEDLGWEWPREHP